MAADHLLFWLQARWPDDVARFAVSARQGKYWNENRVALHPPL